MSTLNLLKSSCVGHFLDNKERIFQCLNLLDDDSIWLQQNSNLNSIGNLITHLNGNIRQYVISSLGSEKDQRERHAEFSNTLRLSMADLIDRHESTITEAIRIIKDVQEDELKKVRMVQGFEMNGVDILMHVTEHYSYHTGQIVYMTKAIRNIDLEFYKDLDLNIRNEGK